MSGEHREVGGPVRYVTEAEVEVMITRALIPFHRENSEKFERLFAAMNQLTGSVKTGVWIIGLMLTVVAIVLGVKH